MLPNLSDSRRTEWTPTSAVIMVAYASDAILYAKTMQALDTSLRCCLPTTRETPIRLSSSRSARSRGEPAGSLQTKLGFHNLISWSGLDIGRDRGSPVSHYDAPFEFTGQLLRVTVAMHDDQKLDGDDVGDAELARQ
jgi:hypothetical protein